MIRASVLLVACATVAASANPNLIVNGEFAGSANGWIPDAAGGGYQNSAGQGGNTGWFWINSSGGADIPNVSQLVTGLTPGSSYEVTGYYRTVAIFNPNDVFQALVDEVVVFSGVNQRVDWTQFSFTFVASDSDALLRFRAEVTADSDWGLDTVSMVLIPTPAAFGAFGLAGLVATRRRR